MTLTAPAKAPARWSDFEHLDPNKYMNYYYVVNHTPRGGAVDVDGQRSKSGTMWALHWGTVGKNHLHDPKKLIISTRHINDLNDDEIGRLRGPSGQRPHKMLVILTLALSRGVRIEVELKVKFTLTYMRHFMAHAAVAALHKAKLLQFKTLAKMTGPSARLRPAHEAGGVTILSFNDYTGPGIDKTYAWPVTDYYRGKPKWR